jgi:hypothetical protein
MLNSMAYHMQLVVGLGAIALAASELIVMKPQDGKTGVDKVLIVINGANVPNTDYVDVAKAVQSASALKLWVAIPSFVINTPNPGQIDSKIKDGISALEKAGFPGTVKAGSDVVVAGHSLGGIFSQGAVVSGGYTALVLFGSYLSSINGYAVNKYPKPALTLAGELDGLTRITRIAQSFEELQDLIATKGPDAAYTHPVVALPGQTHSQFCSNVNVTAFGTKDKCPEVPLVAAHSAIGSTVSAFLSVIFSSGDISAAKAKLSSGMKYTDSLVSGYLKARKSVKAGDWCARAQQQEALLSKTKISVAVTLTSNFASFDATNPSVTGSSVKAVQELQYKLNPGDLSTFDLSSQEVDCKIKTAAALGDEIGKAAPSQDSNTCRTLNDQAIDYALDLVSADTKARYISKLKPLVTKDDDVYTTGVTWQAASFTFHTGDKSVSVGSPRLTSGLKASVWPGDQLCKYLSPDRVIEYMQVDGLPAFDSCPHSSSTNSVVV